MAFRFRQARTVIATSLIAVVLTGCDFTPVGLDFGGRLMSVVITGETIVTVADTIHLSATGSLDGLIGILSYDPLRDARWSSSDASIASVVRPPASPEDTLASSALVIGLRPGRVLIEASARGVTGTRAVVVTRIPARPTYVR